MVLSWLHHSISPSIMNSVLWLDFAYDVWRDLRECFSQGDVFRISALQEEINAFKQDDRSVTDYFTELKILWDKLMNFRPIPVCSCSPSCFCGVFVTLQKYHDNDYVICFLKGLHDRFAAVRSQIMLIDPLPPINKAFSLALPSLKMIGTTRVLHGLYILDSPTQTFSISTPIALSANTTSCSLWHHRLSHLSDS
ncbi:uncharacterized protein LOC128034803 [Gossypium raimondii]|uniref:uncharacterized protein LOC128034803 n=1 Tax=Gossypium raimondii TaxID=29730 RepID=UPI00227A5DCB|nr:uncharacterized protein LOC128034803 [Gossypium raimondii]